MEMENKTKRSYTVPVMLVIMTVMMLVIVIFASKYLVLRQEDSLKDGQRLAEKYADAAMFAQKLRDGAEFLLSAAQEEDRIRGNMAIAQALTVSGDFIDLLAEAAHRSRGIDLEEARQQYGARMEQLKQRLGTAEEPIEPLTVQNPEFWSAVRDGAAQISEALQAFRLPTVDAGHRSMAAGEGWLEPALAAGEAWTSLAARLKQVAG